MNILFISPNSPHDSIGGVERYITNLVDYCKNQSKFSTFLMLPTCNKSRTEHIGRVTIYHENCLAPVEHKAGRQKNISANARIFSQHLDKIIKEHSIDIICAVNLHIVPPAYTLLLNMIARLHNIPLVLQLHSFAGSDLQTELVNQLMWDQVSCVSKSVAGDCFQKGANIDTLSTHYLGVNTQEFNNPKTESTTLKDPLGLPHEARIVLTATRILRGYQNILQQKGVINLIQAFSKLSPRFPELRLLIAIGRPPEQTKEAFKITYEMLIGYLKLHDIDDRTIVKMYGLDEMPDVYRGSDIFVLASENETFGQVFIEAMACGLPVIGTKVGGIPEIISDSYNGYLIHPDDSSLLAQKIAILLNDRSVRERFIEAGMKTVEQTFTSERQFTDFFNMLEETGNRSAPATVNQDYEPDGVQKP